MPSTASAKAPVRSREPSVPQVTLDGNAAYLGKALVELQVTAVGRKYGEADWRGVVDPVAV